MAPRNTYIVTFRGGRRGPHRGITNNPARRKHRRVRFGGKVMVRDLEHRRVRPGGKVMVNGKAKTRIGALRAEAPPEQN